jgi:hypothetical protein
MSGPEPGVLHPVDQAFYDLTVKERDYERIRSDRLEAERDSRLTTERADLEYFIRRAFPEEHTQ